MITTFQTLRDDAIGKIGIVRVYESDDQEYVDTNPPYIFTITAEIEGGVAKIHGTMEVPKSIKVVSELRYALYEQGAKVCEFTHKGKKVSVECKSRY
jgi:hypothetical protein